MAKYIINLSNETDDELKEAIQHYFPSSDPKPQRVKKHLKKQLNVLINRYKNTKAKLAVNIPIDNTLVDVNEE